MKYEALREMKREGERKEENIAGEEALRRIEVEVEN